MSTTPRPWYFQGAHDGKGVITETHNLPDGGRMTHFVAICDSATQDNEANARLIVKAVNNYDKLVAALKQLEAAVDIAMGDSDIVDGPDALADAMCIAGQALAVVKEE